MEAILTSPKEKALTNFFKPTSQKQKEPEKVTWRIINNSLLIGKYQESRSVTGKENEQRQKIAAFDFVCNAVGPGRFVSQC
jgi:bifunctional polynucleotide phosphatase/kinase